MLLLKVFMMVLDIGLKLDPKFNFGKEVTPYLTKTGGCRQHICCIHQKGVHLSP